MFDDVTIIIKTFERPGALRKLLLSIGRTYGGESIKILVADDSRETFRVDFRTNHEISVFKLPFDSGAGSGRNFLLDRLETEYFVSLDDDFVFFGKTRIEDLVDVLRKNSGIDLAAGLVQDIPKHWWQKKKTRDISRTISISGNILRRSKTPLGRAGGFEAYNFLPNFFAARTGRIRGVRWDDYLKTVDHTAFFLDCARKGIVSVEVPSVIVRHLREKNRFYNMYRNDRRNSFIEYLHRKYSYNREIETS